MDFKALFTRFSNDVIATAAFGVQVDSLKDKNNEFYKNALQILDFGLLAILKMTVLIMCPKLLKVRQCGKFDHFFLPLLIYLIFRCSN